MPATPEQLEEIARYRKMAEGDADDDLAHYRLGESLMKAGEYPEAITAFERTLAITPGFSRVFQYLGTCLINQGEKDKAIEVLTRGWLTANERGDRIPMEAIGKLLTSVGAPIPAPPAPKIEDDGSPDTGFRCKRPMCAEGKRARPLTAPPFADALGTRIQNEICEACWTIWLKDQSVKLINENRYDLSSDFHQQEYDRYMREFLGFEDEPKA